MRTFPIRKGNKKQRNYGTKNCFEKKDWGNLKKYRGIKIFKVFNFQNLADIESHRGI